MTAPGPTPWHAVPAPEVLAQLGTKADLGLSPDEAARRLAEHGPNDLPVRAGPSLLSLLLAQLGSFLVLLLIVAAGISVALGKWIDASVILAIVLLNAGLGAFQEHRAERSLAALRRLAAPLASVVRDGRPERMPARGLVPGDLVLLETGDFVPADLRLLEGHNLRVDESTLTGESVPVDKDPAALLPHRSALGDRRNCAYSGTVVSYGRGSGVVVATGLQTELGRIAGLLAGIENEATPLQVALSRFGRSLGLVTLGVSALVFITGALRGTEILPLLLTAVSLAVAAVPEGLAAVVTIVLSRGMQRMVQRQVLIRRLPAVETLGSVTAICSDKTGTLTQNQMTVVRVWTPGGGEFLVGGQGYRPEGRFARAVAGTDFLQAGDGLPPPDGAEGDPALRQALLVAALCNDAKIQPPAEDGGAWRIVGDPTEGALVVAAHKAGLTTPALAEGWPRVAEVPFDSGRKRMSTVHRVGSGSRPGPAAAPLAPSLPVLVCVKGAPDLVLELCDRWVGPDGEPQPAGEELRTAVKAAYSRYAGEALRVLAVAFRELPAEPEEISAASLERSLTLAGLMAMVDPVRPEAAPAVRACRSAGIKPLMVTGDHRETALAVGRQLGLAQGMDEVVSGEQLGRMSQAELVSAAGRASIFARVAPEHKVLIVDALKQGSGHIVAMTGDGVNDAPALKRADIGVAMGITGTAVARETADIILADDNFASIVAAVEEGRRIFGNIRKFVFYLLSCNVSEVMLIFGAMLLGLPLPLRPIHLLWVNLGTDSLPALALGLEPAEPDLMSRPPRDPREPIISRLMRRNIAVQATVGAAATLGAFWLTWRSTGDLLLSQTVTFASLVLAQLLRAHTSRSETHTVWRLGLAGNVQVLGATGLSALMLLALVYLPPLRATFGTAALGPGEWAVVAPMAALPALAAELTKVLTARRSPPS